MVEDCVIGKDGYIMPVAVCLSIRSTPASHSSSSSSSSSSINHHHHSSRYIMSAPNTALRMRRDEESTATTSSGKRRRMEEDSVMRKSSSGRRMEEEKKEEELDPVMTKFFELEEYAQLLLDKKKELASDNDDYNAGLKIVRRNGSVQHANILLNAAYSLLKITSHKKNNKTLLECISILIDIMKGFFVIIPSTRFDADFAANLWNLNSIVRSMHEMISPYTRVLEKEGREDGGEEEVTAAMD